jgi:hypothetical protein
MKAMTEEQKMYTTSIWLCINRTPLTAGNASIIKRCNTSIAFAGVKDNVTSQIDEIHYEPAILESDLKYINYYYNQTVPVPQAEWYLTTQMNYYTQNVTINDRFIIGGVDLDVRDNNATYKVKAVVKSPSTVTFQHNKQHNTEQIPLVIIALDKDLVDAQDDLETRLANNATKYFINKDNPIYEYYIRLKDADTEGNYRGKVLQGYTENYTVELVLDDTVQKANFNVTAELIDMKNGKQMKDENYYVLKSYDKKPNSFSVENIKSCPHAKLKVTCSCTNPSNKDKEISETFEIKLGGFY